MKQRILRNIAKYQLWSPGDQVAIAVSGGQDSMALLSLLSATQGVHGGKLTVISVNHGLRPESAIDAEFVAQYARQLNITAEVASVNLAQGANEEQARLARYRIFDSLSVDRIALGHHRRDQAETLLIRLLRGGGARGLGGMRWRRDRFVRPMLDFSPIELHEWSRRMNIPFRTDPTNQEVRFLRNRIRHELLPILENIRPGSEAVLARNAERLGKEAEALSRSAEQIGEPPWRREQLMALPEAVLTTRWLANPYTTWPQAQAALFGLHQGKGVFDFGSGWKLHISKDWVDLIPPP